MVASGTDPGFTETPSRVPPEKRKAAKPSLTQGADRQATLLHFAARKAAIIMHAASRDRLALLRALREEERNALRALTRGKRVETEVRRLEALLRKAGREVARNQARPMRPRKARRKRLTPPKP